MLNDLKTCLTLLRRAEIQSLLNVFDNVLKLNCYPSALPDHDETIQPNPEEDPLPCKKESTKLVEIEKTDQPLGVTISRTDAGEIHIARLIVGGHAVTTQQFQVNDRILEINDQPVSGHSLDYICSLMSKTIGSIKFLLVSPTNSNSISYQTFHVRALFDYDPSKDPLMPCKELGLAFQRGDILRIVAREENLSTNIWWQAFREHPTESSTDSSLAGLIPSDNLQRKRRDVFASKSDESSSREQSKKTNTLCFTCRSSKHGGRSLPMGFSNVSFLPQSNENETATIRTSTHHFSFADTRQFDDEKCTRTMPRYPQKTSDCIVGLLHFYQPVFRLNSSTEKIIRPIVLLGAPNVGRHELRRRLLQNDSQLFELAIPHTTRARRLEETPDIDYHFVSEADFLAQVACHSFIEFGQYDRHLYGTSIDAVRTIGQIKGKICLLNLNPDALKTFEKTDLYPYVIFIGAPLSIERLKRLTLDRREHLTERDYRDILRRSQSIERQYRDLFDHVLINDDLDQTYYQLKDLIDKIQHDPQQWIRTSYRL